MEATDTTSPPPLIAGGEKTKARDIIAAIRTLQQVESEKRPATEAERQTLARFGGFGAVWQWSCNPGPPEPPMVEQSEPTWVTST
jgi:hypothetical protein